MRASSRCYQLRLGSRRPDFFNLVAPWFVKPAAEWLPEARNYRNAARYLASFATDPNELRLVLIPRVGKPLFYQGGDLRPRAGIPLDL